MTDRDESQSRPVSAGVRSRLPKPAGSRRRFRKALGSRGAVIAWLTALVSGAGALGGLVGTSAGFPPTLGWVLGLLHHWQWAYLMVGLTAGITGFLCGRRLTVVPAAVVLGIWSVHLQALPQAEEGASGSTTSRVLRVTSVNLNFNTPDVAGLTRWLSGIDMAAWPDILVLQEFTPRHERAIVSGRGVPVARQSVKPATSTASTLASIYPHHLLYAQPDQFGIAVLSRWPITNSTVIDPITAEDTAMLRLVIDWAGKAVSVTAVHPMPPISTAYAAARDRSLLTEAQRLNWQQMPGILVGDFNDTPWSQGMRALQPYLARASGLTPTWPNAGGSFSVLTLDHILATRHWQRFSTGVGPSIGSDHRPVNTAISLAQ